MSKVLTVKDVRKQLTKALKDISRMKDNMPVGVVDITDDYRFCEGLGWGNITDFKLFFEKFIGDDSKPVLNFCLMFSGTPLDDEGEYEN